MIAQNVLPVPADTIPSTNLFPVVGVGASAGGLEAFKKLLSGIPEESGMAYVLVQHLDPTHESILAELLQKVTKIPVLEISDDIKVEPNHIYVIPSNKMMVANDGILKLTPRDLSKNKRNLPIDLFFTSLAEVHQAHAIGIVLSGTGTDGTAGLKAIRDYGGLTLAQDEKSAAFNGMPGSAVKANVVDFVLSPEGMPQKILDLNESILRGNEVQKPLHDELVFKEILSLLRMHKETDFTYYKQTTIRRRIIRRMALNKSSGLTAYLKFLKENISEQDKLYQDMLIPVTSFFRDEKVFAELCESVFPILIKNKQPYEPIRVWIAGCSTGEEAYSIAMCFKEFLGDHPEKVQIFATDLSEPAITKARSGIYSASQLNGVSAQRLNQFFVKKNDGYYIKKEIRDMCVFALHNFLKDPPFGKIDMITCRNVLIYMEPYLQKKAMTTFHYALKPHGILLLGKSETTRGATDLFTATGKIDKIFSRNDVSGRYMHVATQRNETSIGQSAYRPKNEIVRSDFQKTADEIILAQYSPAGVIVNETLDIVNFRGNTSNYLEQPSGKPSHNLLKMAKPELAFELRNLLLKVRKENVKAKKEGISFKIDTHTHHISIEAIPLPNASGIYFLVLFHNISNNNISVPEKSLASGKAVKDAKDVQIAQLQQDLLQMHKDIRSITEDQEATNAELQRDNEELLSGSEELQSLNEELETSKEELQSTNEELTVVNHEILSLNELVTEARDFAEAIVATIREPLLVLDKNLRVQKANFAFYNTFHVNERDTEGVLIYDLGNKQWNIPALRKLLEKILPKKSTFNDFEIAHTFSNIGERVMLLNAREIKKDNESEKLILLAIEDITEQKKAEEIQSQIQKSFQFIADAMPQKVWTADADGNYNYFNKYWLDYTGLAFEELKNWGWEKIIHPGDTVKNKKQWRHSIDTGDDFEMEERFLDKAGTYKWHLSRGISYKDDNGKIIMWVGTNTEIEEQRKEKEKLEKAVLKRTSELLEANVTLGQKNEELEKMNNELQSFTYVSSHDLQEPLRKIQLFTSRILETEYSALSNNGKDLFQKVNNTSRRMQTLIEDLLAYSHTAIVERRFEDTNLQRILDDVKNDLAEHIREKNAVIESDALGNASINPFQFRQVLQNLLSNAIKFSKPDLPPHINIKSEIAEGKQLQSKNKDLSLARLSSKKKYYHLTFSDNGIGFDPKYKDRIFEVFQRLNSKEAYAGTGIGLAIVKKIIENHNGCITATGVLNSGASFDIYLPIL